VDGGHEADFLYDLEAGEGVVLEGRVDGGLSGFEDCGLSYARLVLVWVWGRRRG
jgi:hypothetical protein